MASQVCVVAAGSCIAARRGMSDHVESGPRISGTVSDRTFFFFDSPSLLHAQAVTFSVHFVK